MLQDRPVNEKKRRRRQDGKEMMNTLIEDFSVTLMIMKETNVKLDQYQIQRVYASNEWDHLCNIFDELPRLKDIRTPIWRNISYNARNNLCKSDEGYREEEKWHMPMDQTGLTEHIHQMVESLNQAFDQERYKESEFYDELKWVYDSQVFCQLTGPILEHPQLANKYKRELQIIRKKGVKK